MGSSKKITDLRIEAGIQRSRLFDNPIVGGRSGLATAVMTIILLTLPACILRTLNSEVILFFFAFPISACYNI